MGGLARGGAGALGLLLVLLVMTARAREVVLQIQDISQPYNCSHFFDTLEVRSECNAMGPRLKTCI